jgi:hypothetical protein
MDLTQSSISDAVLGQRSMSRISAHRGHFRSWAETFSITREHEIWQQLSTLKTGDFKSRIILARHLRSQPDHESGPSSHTVTSRRNENADSCMTDPWIPWPKPPNHFLTSMFKPWSLRNLPSESSARFGFPPISRVSTWVLPTTCSYKSSTIPSEISRPR